MKRVAIATLATALVALQLVLAPAALAGHTLATPIVTPASPANNNNPVVSGTTTAANGASVTIYTTASCSGPSQGSGTVAAGAYSVTVSVADNSSRTFYARVRDHNTNVCSNGVAYLEDSAAPSTISFSSPDTSPDEGSTITYDFSAADANLTGAGGIAMTGTSGDCGSGTKVGGSDDFSDTSGAASGTGSFQCIFPDGPAATSISVTVTDKAGNVATSPSTTVNVQNVAPTVSFTSGTTSPATDHNYTYDYLISDPGQDTITVATSCGAGTKSNASNSDTSGSFECLWTASGPDTVTAQATDSDSDAGSTANHSVTVGANQGPTVALSGSNDTSVDEGQVSIEYAYSIVDPEGDDTGSVVTDCGAVGTKVVGSDDYDNDNGSFECVFPDGPDSSNVSVYANDSLGVAGNADSQIVTVANVAPTVEFTSGTTTAATDHTYTYEYSISDPGQDTIADVATSCGTGTQSNASNTSTSGAFDCSFTAAGLETITAQATDSDSAVGSNASLVVLVALNEGPTVTLDSTNDTSVDEGSSAVEYEYTIDDLEGDDTQSVNTSCGTSGTKVVGSDEFDNDNGSFECVFPDGPDASTVSVSATDSFDMAGNTDNQTISIANVGPMLTFTSGPESVVAEHTYTYEYSLSDVGQDSISSVTTSCGVGGTISGATNSDTSGSFDCTWASSGSASITAEATDSDGLAGNTDTVAVTIAPNQGPAVTLSGSNPTTVDEGPDEWTYTFSISEAEGDTVASVTTSCGTGGTKVSGSDTFTQTSGSFRCTFTQGPASPTVSVQAIDVFGEAGNTDTQSVTVENVAPSVDLSGPDSADEGDTETYTYTVSDPGDDVDSVVETCGSGATYINTLAPASFDCTFPDGPAFSEVSVMAEDTDSASGTDTVTVSVSNIAPAVTLTGVGAAAEGDTRIYTYTVSDPGDDPNPEITEGCGSNGNYSSDAAANSFECTFPDGPVTSDVSVSADDGVGIGTDTKTVTVTNVAPTVLINGPDEVAEGTSHTFTYTVTDPGDDADSVVTEECGSNGTYTADADPNSFSCTFPDGPQSSPVKVTVDDGAATGSDTKPVSIANVTPMVELVGASAADEGDTKTYTYTVSDPSDEPDATVTEECGANGNYAADADANSFTCIFPDGPASSDVSVSVDDGDDEGNDTVTVAIANVAPTVELSGPDAADEGDTKTYTYTVSDPSDEPDATVTEECGANGNYAADADANSFTCTFPDGPASSDVSLSVDDGDDEGNDAVTVAIGNVAPTVELSGPDAADEGDTKTYTYTVTDLGDDASPTITESCGSNGTYIDTLAPASFDCTFPDGPASSDVSLSADDGDDEGSDTVTVAIGNVAPTVTLDGPTLVNEKTSATFTFTVADPGTDSFSIESGYPDCGLGTLSDGATVTGSAGTYVCEFPAVSADTQATTSILVSDTDGAASTVAEHSFNIIDVRNGGGGGGGGPEPVPISDAPPSDNEPPIAEGGPDSDRISPNGDGRLDAMHLSATFSEDANWSLTIETSTTDVTSSGALSFAAATQIVYWRIGYGTSVDVEWDGTSQSGEPVEDGIYRWTLGGTDAEGNEIAPLTGSIVIDRASPVLAKLRISHLRHRRHGHRHKKIRFALNEAATVAVKVRAQGRLVKRFAPITADARQTVSLVWNCRNDAGHNVQDGRYRLIVKAVDLAGNQTVRPIRIRVRS